MVDATLLPPDAAPPRPFSVTVPATGDVYELSFEAGPLVRVTKGPAQLRLVQTKVERSPNWGNLGRPGDSLRARCTLLSHLPVGRFDEGSAGGGSFWFRVERGPKDEELQKLIRDELVRRGWLAAGANVSVEWAWGALTPAVTFDAGARSPRTPAVDRPQAPTVADESKKTVDEMFGLVPGGGTAGYLSIAFACDLILGTAHVTATTATGPTLTLVADGT